MPGQPGLSAEGALIAAMWSYAGNAFYPVQQLRRSGVLPKRTVAGDLPLAAADEGLGRRFSSDGGRPVLLARESPNGPLVAEFDRMAEIYALHTEFFSQPIFDEALDEMRRFLPPRARVLDAGCGVGHELQRVARLLPEGEVVGLDLSAGMIQAAWSDARAHGFENCAFFQADVAALPAELDGQFDLVFSSLAHHHYPDPAGATSSVLRVLRPGGVYCVIDAGPDWFVKLGSEIARHGDPGWIGFHTPEQFRALFATGGFERTAWVDLLPGFGMAVGQKPLMPPSK
jgi:SAM-dependent methyltransferase